MQTTIEQGTEFSLDFEMAQYEGQFPRTEILEKAMKFIEEEVNETIQAIKDENREEIIDGFGDVAFLALNGIYKEFRTSGDSHDVATSKVQVVMQRICTANNGKRQEDGKVKYVNGKVQKPEGWKAPEYGDLL